MNMQFHTFDHFSSLSEALSQQWLDVIQQAPAETSFALAGGSTPAPIYQRLDQRLSKTSLQHPIKLVATDERWVADADAQSNEGLFRRCLSTSAPAHQWQLVSLKNTASTPEIATEAIHARLTEQFPAAFSAVLLGMGTDGHIASLFPGAPTQHDDLSCLAALHPQTRQSRMSLSLPRLLNTERIWLVITGTEKRKILDTATAQNLPVASLLHQAGCTIDVFWCP
ncbi:6-phosphogluconolactonase [Undibacterium sp. SXout7W]|uniref:6-phosphogluconolactonase n=1 Tax=Undibacterium sp. SXout7W TaxID=3413049 RepID=UPI003BF202F9